MLVSLIIPCFNEDATIEAVLERVSRIHIPGARREIIVVDDGSSDRTPEIVDAFEFPSDVTAHIYHAPINMGKGVGLRVGLSMATGDVIAFQDADLELDPRDLPKLIEPVLRGEADIVFGSRFLDPSNRNIPLKTRRANAFLSKMTNLLFGGNLTDMETAYKVFHRRVADRLRLRCAEFDIEPEITAKMLRLGYSIREAPIRFTPRSVREGKTIGWSDGIQAIWTLLRVRCLPISACGRVSAAPKPQAQRPILSPQPEV